MTATSTNTAVITLDARIGKISEENSTGTSNKGQVPKLVAVTDIFSLSPKMSGTATITF
jgi:hypothetical protein